MMMAKGRFLGAAGTQGQSRAPVGAPRACGSCPVLSFLASLIPPPRQPVPVGGWGPSHCRRPTPSLTLGLQDVMLPTEEKTKDKTCPALRLRGGEVGVPAPPRAKPGSHRWEWACGEPAQQEGAPLPRGDKRACGPPLPPPDSAFSPERVPEFFRDVIELVPRREKSRE